MIKRMEGKASKIEKERKTIGKRIAEFNEVSKEHSWGVGNSKFEEKMRRRSIYLKRDSQKCFWRQPKNQSKIIRISIEEKGFHERRYRSKGI